MSDYESHTGKLKRVLPQGIETFEEMCKRLWIENGQKSEEYKEGCLFGEFFEKYFKVNGICWEVFDHEDLGNEDDMFCRIHDNKDGTYTFDTRFYNGGTCMGEMLEDEIKKIK